MMSFCKDRFENMSGAVYSKNREKNYLIDMISGSRKDELLLVRRIYIDRKH